MFNPSTLEIAKAIKSPLKNVDENWKVVETALNTFHITKDSGRIAALATISVEARTFLPIKEYGNDAYFHRMYDITSSDPERQNVARKLGNDTPGDGIRYCGRGFVQTTGKHNYFLTGKAIGCDLVRNPDELLKPLPAALALAFYFASHGVDVWAEKALHSTAHACEFCKFNGLSKSKRRPSVADVTCELCAWKTVRRIVNGGLTAFNEFNSSVQNLKKLVK